MVLNRSKSDILSNKYYNIITAVIFVTLIVVIAVVVIVLSKPAASSNIDNSLQEYIVDLHNKYRSLVANGRLGNQPSASNMKKINWNNTLATFAETWVQKCNYEHSKSDYGENLAVGTIFESMTEYDYKTNFDHAMRMWAEEEHLNFDYPTTCVCRHATNCQCGHYTQIVWAQSNTVGCAIIQCNGMNGNWILPKSQLTFLISCNYAPPGNMWINGIAQPPYKLGSPCGDCPNDTPRCNDHGLCY